MCPLAMPFEGIGVKEGIGGEGTQPPYAQIGMTHMSTDGGMGGQGSLRAPLNLAADRPGGHPLH